MIVCFIPCNQNPEDRIGVCICICSIMFSLSNIIYSVDSPFMFFFFFSKISIWISVAALQMRPYTSCHLPSIRVLIMCIESFLEILCSSSNTCTPMFLVKKALSLELLQLYNLFSYVVSLYTVFTPFSSVHGFVLHSVSNRLKLCT